MEDETYTTPVESIAQLDLDVVGRTCNAAFVNHSARDINIRDCTTHVTFIPAPPLQDDFRRIPLGDIDLLQEIHVDYASGIVDLPHERGRVQRRNGSKIFRNIVRFGKFYIHTLVQLDLIPLAQILGQYRHSPILTVYIYACSDLDHQVRKLTEHSRLPTFVQEVNHYFHSEFQQWLLWEKCTFWIRRSTGRLCIELIPPRNSIYLEYNLDQEAVPLRIQGNYLLSASVTDAMVIDTLTLEAYHRIFYYNLDHLRRISISTPMTVNLGTVFRCSYISQPEDCSEIASVSVLPYMGSWWSSNKSMGEKMEDGRTRFHSNDLFNTSIATFVDIDESPEMCRQVNE
ncbi:hypothetical protein MVEN_00022900 [Mycena venus]|uniref:Uncharacterized protein n=1 Tax=Mycena venus TaxID=2733690 RepID=A0A8H7DGS6_9AGAR|nr:hypothetical protein MVEN_00022900 [Mycena venus]